MAAESSRRGRVMLGRLGTAKLCNGECGSTWECPEKWHESLDGDCKLLKKCIEIARSCCDHDPHSRPTIHNIILMLDETETMIQMIPPSINTEPRNDPMSSLYQFLSRTWQYLNALEHILEGRRKPNNLSYSLLQFMTKNFSVERKMGNNEFGDFFKVVAVVRLSGSLKINDRMFHGEVKITMTAQHQNIVRFLGNCSYAAKEEASIHGKTTNTEIRERLLCFEYLSNGSLKKHISGTIKKLSNT
ncbi:unnamed protein product [Miscanthus lutarioriparius]|uniref:Protein kinase domain-containing protein n=1 Tax=Miscanthus lutarioriparius TaxID=422564 RepID=A0A811QIW8_9POAL|nr:unnamed protein product [Miscanthus lutarioriparius]